jgi:hypothetical protein
MPKSAEFLHSMRKDGDSNPGNALDVYTLSRRASSTTRASFPGLNFERFQYVCICALARLRVQNYCFFCKMQAFLTNI